jgi:hypothetical protein
MALDQPERLLGVEPIHDDGSAAHGLTVAHVLNGAA